jgi:hypothetical protein
MFDRKFGGSGMATELCEKCKQAHPGRVCDYDEKGECAETRAEVQVRSAHQLLTALHDRIGQHPEIGEAITKLEMALNLLAVKTGGML